jgi:hypothetical protein
MRCGDEAVLILDEMKMFNEQVAPTRTVGQQSPHFHECLWVDLSALWSTPRSATPARRRLGRRLFRNAHLIPLNREKRL